MFAPLGCVFLLSARVNKMNVGAAQVSFWLFAALMGLSLSSIFLIYTGELIHARVLCDSSSLRSTQPIRLHNQEGSLWFGYIPHHGCDRHRAGVSRQPLARSSAMQFALSVIGVLVFAGLLPTTRTHQGIYSEVRYD